MKRLIGLIGWLGVALVLAAVALRFLRPELQPWHQRLALAGLIVTAIYALTQWRDIARTFQGRNVRYGSFAATSVVLVLGILVALNWISSRENKRWDLTAAGQFSLSDQTKQILRDLKKPVTVHVFYAGTPTEYRDRLNEYGYFSKEITADYVDAERNPVQAQKYGVTTVPTLVLEYDGRTEKSSAADEESLTNALKKLVEGKTKKIYFLQGHGEHDPTSSDPTGYSGVADALKTDNFDVAKLTLAQEGKVPDDATIIVEAGPTVDPLPKELELLGDFLKKGGKVAIFLDPPAKGTAPDVTNLIAFAKSWGIDVGNNIIVDASGLGQLIGTDASVPIAMPVEHAITQNFGLMTAFPLARSVAPIEGGTDGHVAQKLLQTSPQSWGETDVKGLYATGHPERNIDKGDLAGPVSLAVAVDSPVTDTSSATPASADAPKPESRLVVVGDSDFASNRAVNIQGNRDIFLNMANWLAQQENLIAIHPKSPQDRPIAMTADQGQLVFWFTMVIVPLLLFGNGIRVWWTRR